MKVSTCHHHHSPKELQSKQLETALEQLRKAGVRITNPRKQILGALLKDVKPLSAEGLFQQLKAKGLDLVTVYRNLQLLEEKGLLQKFEFADGIKRFEFRKHHHHYIECKNCGDVQSFEGCDFEGSILKILEFKGFKLIEHQLSVLGICPACA